MCGQFIFFADDDEERIKKLIEDNLPGISGMNKFNMKRGNVYPSQSFPIIHSDREKPEVTDMKWGYPPASRKSKSPLINARAETAAEKYTFRYDFYHRRCLIPATGFYEWNPEKVKYLFTDDSGLLFLGGLYTVTNATDESESEDKFVILTKKPDEIVSPIHNRMPVLIPPHYAMNWLNDASMAKELINNYSLKLKDSPVEPQQLRMF